jgi:hypothetical protein
MWSIIRIVLVVLNVLGAIVISIMAGQDYGTRQRWAYANLLHDVAIRGLPLDKEEMDSETRKVVEILGEQGDKEIFAGQGSPVATQVDEVNRVKSKLDGSITAHTDKRDQTVSLAHVLSPLAVSEAQREQLLAIQTYLLTAKTAEQLKADVARAATAARDDKRKPAKPFEVAFIEELEALPGPSRLPFEEAYLAEQKKAPAKKPEELFDDSIEQIRQNLQKTYDDAFAPATSGLLGGQKLAPSEQKAIIASLLFNLVEPLSEAEVGQPAVPGQAFDLAQGPYKRYLTVVGLEAGVKAIDRQKSVLARMNEELNLETKRDRTLFVTTHQDLVNQLQQGATKAGELTEALARQKDLVAKHQALVARRKEDVKLFEGELVKLGKETAERLAEVRTMSDELYKIRVATRNAGEANQAYEKKIHSLEEGR